MKRITKIGKWIARNPVLAAVVTVALLAVGPNIVLFGHDWHAMWFPGQPLPWIW